MKKCKLIFKVDGKNRGKVYIGHKWQKDVAEINIHGGSDGYTIEIEKYKRDSRGMLCVDGNELARETKAYKICSLR